MAGVETKSLWRFIHSRSAEIITADGLRRLVASGRRLRVKLGIDPTMPDLHLGHVVPLEILRAFQSAGHRAVLIIGDFTGQIGDPSAKAATRRELTPAEVKRNERTYLRHVGRVLDLGAAEVRHNSQWFGKMPTREFLRLLAHFSLRSAWERDDFQNRLRAGKAVHLHEAMYPILQAYDSVAVRADIELGGLDQKLNILAGRELQPFFGQQSQEVVLTPYLMGLDGRLKMSKSAGNTINLGDTAGEMFGKVMSVPDRLITHYAELAAWMDADHVRVITKRLAAGANPRDVKLDVAEAVAARYHGAATARRSRGEFLAVFSLGKPPASMTGITLAPGAHSALALLAACGVLSRSEARRVPG